MVQLYDALRASYGHSDGINNLRKKGFNKDSSLSNGNQQVFVNPTKKKVVYTVAGTHNLSDWATDARMMVGGLKNTGRYKEAKQTLEKTRNKYKDYKFEIAGHSLGGSIAKNIASRGDKMAVYDAGYVGEKIRNNPGQKHYRTYGDLVSIFSENAHHQINLAPAKKAPFIFMSNALTSHDLGQIKNKHIKI